LHSSQCVLVHQSTMVCAWGAASSAEFGMSNTSAIHAESHLAFVRLVIAPVWRYFGLLRSHPERSGLHLAGAHFFCREKLYRHIPMPSNSCTFHIRLSFSAGPRSCVHVKLNYLISLTTGRTDEATCCFPGSAQKGSNMSVRHTISPTSMTRRGMTDIARSQPDGTTRCPVGNLAIELLEIMWL
jgi:hypothetical protein